MRKRLQPDTYRFPPALLSSREPTADVRLLFCLKKDYTSAGLKDIILRQVSYISPIWVRIRLNTGIDAVFGNRGREAVFQDPASIPGGARPACHEDGRRPGYLGDVKIYLFFLCAALVISMDKAVMPYDGARSFFTIRHSVRPQGLCAFSLLPVVVGCRYLSSPDGLHDHCGSLLVEEPLAHVVHIRSHVGEIFSVSVAEIV